MGKKSKKIQALLRSQNIENQLRKSIIESEALQNSGDDRPEGETHVNDILDNDKVSNKIYNKKIIHKNKKLIVKKTSKKVSKNSLRRKR